MDLPARATSVSHLSELTAAQVSQSVAQLGLSTRSFRCIGADVTVAQLLGTVEADLMSRRNFGRACLADVRRQLTIFALDALSVPEHDPRRALLGTDDSSLAAGFGAPAQPRTLREVLEELLELLRRQSESRRKPLVSARGRLTGRQQRASLSDIAELLFGCLTAREREVAEVLFNDGAQELPSFADIGRRVGLSRERVRQIVNSANARIKADAERRRRDWLTKELLGTFDAAGGVLSQRQVSEALRRKHSGSKGSAEGLARMLLEITPDCQCVHSNVWCAGLDPERVLATIERLHGLLRRNSRIMALNQLAAALRQRAAFRVTPDELIAGCIAADSRFREYEGRRIGLREWEWGIPRSAEEYVIACLRSSPLPLTLAAVSEAVRSLLPPGREIAQATIQRILAGPECIELEDGTFCMASRR